MNGWHLKRVWQWNVFVKCKERKKKCTNNNKHKLLSCNEEIDEEEECYTIVKDNESSVVATNEKSIKEKQLNAM